MYNIILKPLQCIIRGYIFTGFHLYFICGRILHNITQYTALYYNDETSFFLCISSFNNNCDNNNRYQLQTPVAVTTRLQLTVRKSGWPAKIGVDRARECNLMIRPGNLGFANAYVWRVDKRYKISGLRYSLYPRKVVYIM